MPVAPIRLRPGVNLEETRSLNDSGWSESKSIRFFGSEGLPEKEGGFVAFVHATPNSGVPQVMRAWTALSGISLLGIGLSKRVNVSDGGGIYDLTPNTVSSRIPLSLSTTSGSTTVVIHDSVNAPTVGEWIQIRDPVSVSDILLLGSYEVISVGAGTYTIAAEAVIPGTVVAGGVARQFITTAGSSIVQVDLFAYRVFPGDVITVPDPTTVGGIVLDGNYLVVSRLSFSLCTIDAGQVATSNDTVVENGGDLQLTFLTPPSGSGSQVDMNIPDATMTTFGEFLLWCPQGGPVYVWMPENNPIPLEPVMTAPLSNNIIFVTSQQQMLFCCGTVNLATGTFDPMLIRFSDVGDYTDFVPSSTNQAGSYRLVAGSKIIGALPQTSGPLFWTDLALYQGIYKQPPLVWGFQPQGLNCGLVGPHAFGTMGQIVVWMSQNNFFAWQGGAPTPLPCTVWDLVFKNIDRANISKVVCETNTFFDEVSWEVPQINGTVTRARLKVETGNWDYTILPSKAFLPRTAWLDQSVFGAPLATDATGQVWQHEKGTDAGTEPLEWSLKSGLIEIAEGDRVTFIRGFYPDIKFTPTGKPGPGAVEMLIYFWGYSQDPPRVKGPFPVNSTTRFVPCKGRARGIQFEFRGRDLGSWARIGRPTYRGAPDGRRP